MMGLPFSVVQRPGVVDPRLPHGCNVSTSKVASNDPLILGSMIFGPYATTLGSIGARNSCMTCRMMCGPGGSRAPSHRSDGWHVAHTIWVQAAPQLTFEQRSYLITNFIKPDVNNCVRCTLCVKKKRMTHKAVLDHVSSRGHQQCLEKFQIPQVCIAFPRQDMSVHHFSSMLVYWCASDSPWSGFAEPGAAIKHEKSAGEREWRDMKESITKVEKRMISIEARLSDRNTPTDLPTCLICMSEPRSRIFLPCHHLAVCHNCELRLIQKVCPVCRSTIQGSMEVLSC